MQPAKMTSNLFTDLPPVLAHYLEGDRNVWMEANPARGRLSLAKRSGAFTDIESLAVERRQHLELLGLNRTRAMLYRIGFEQGRREGRRHLEEYDGNTRLALQAGQVFGQLHGRYSAQCLEFEFNLDEKTLYRDVIYKSSLEAALHRIAAGDHKICACWNSAGYISGHISEILGRRVITLETECVCDGADACRFISRLDSQWDSEVQWIRDALRMQPIAKELTQIRNDVKDREESIAAFQESAAAHESTLAEYKETITALQEAITGHEETISTREATMAEYEETIATREANTAEHKETIANREATIAEHEETIATHEAAIAEHEETIANREATITEHEETIATHEAAIEEYKETLATREAKTAEYEETIATHQATAAEYEATIAQYKETIAAHEAAIAEYDETTKAHETTISEYEKTIAYHEAAMTEYGESHTLNKEIMPTHDEDMARIHSLAETITHETISAGNLDDLIALSEPMIGVIKRARLAVHSPASALIIGEAGAGKEALARAIHASGPNSEQPFITVDCEGVSEQTLTQELFGHASAPIESSAFIRAATGTLYIGEVTKLSHALQGQLLRALQEGKFIPIGATEPADASARIIAASVHDPADQEFTRLVRNDFFDALSIHTIRIPALRQRGTDILRFAETWGEQFRHKYHRQELTMSPEFKLIISEYPWPGNLTELRNVLEHAVIMNRQSPLDVADLPEEILTAPWEKAPKELTIEIVQAALKRTQGNRTHAAELLGVGRTTLWRAIKRLNVA